MKTTALTLSIAFTLLVVPGVARATSDPAELKTLIESQYGGDPLAYVHDKPNQFRRMGCGGRADLRDRGVITGEEFQTLKAEILNRD